MTVQEMLYLMGTLGIGESPAIQTDESTDLKYLNLANTILYRETASVNDDILITEEAQNNGDDFLFLENKSFIIIAVYCLPNPKPLDKVSSTKFFRLTTPGGESGLPRIFYKKKNKITYYPFQENVIYNFKILHAPSITPITTTTDEDDIPYPEEYHQTLVDGGLYYKFSQEGGFRSSSAKDQAEKRWEKSIKDLYNYFNGSNSIYKDLSTYRNL